MSCKKELAGLSMTLPILSLVLFAIPVVASAQSDGEMQSEIAVICTTLQQLMQQIAALPGGESIAASLASAVDAACVAPMQSSQIISTSPVLPAQAPITSQASAQTAASVNTALSGLYNVYSPSVLTYQGIQRMWIGGWLTQADVGPDEIYYSEFDNAAWSQPVVAFSSTTYHVNDPSVVVDPQNPDVLFMYYTALSDQYSSETDITEHNLVGLAISNNGGKTWADQGIVIGQNNGIDDRGAWSPSALVVGNEVWVYYNTNSPGTIDIYRARFDATGKNILGTDLVYQGLGNSTQMTGINVDVSRQGSEYVMLINPTLSGIDRYVSTDGLHWTVAPGDVNPIIVAGPDTEITTPTTAVNADGSPGPIYFASENTNAVSPGFDQIDQVNGTISGQLTYTHPQTGAAPAFSVSCSPSSSSIIADGSITWSASASGGSGGYGYSWADTLGHTASTYGTPSWTQSYSSAGTVGASVSVNDSSGATASASCGSVNVTQPQTSPDYVITSAAMSPADIVSPGIGAFSSMNVTVANQGGNLNNNQSISIVASCPGLPNFQSSILPISSDQSQTTTLSNTLPNWNFQPGSYTCTITPDYYDTFGDKNNTYTLAIQVSNTSSASSNLSNEAAAILAVESQIATIEKELATLLGQ